MPVLRHGSMSAPVESKFSRIQPRCMSDSVGPSRTHAQRATVPSLSIASRSTWGVIWNCSDIIELPRQSAEFSCEIGERQKL